MIIHSNGSVDQQCMQRINKYVHHHNKTDFALVSVTNKTDAEQQQL